MSARRLVDLDPHWVGTGGEGVTRNGQPVPRREAVGIGCECPCGCGVGLYVPFANPLDGGPPADESGWNGSGGWQRTGDTFETLTLSPSIFRKGEGSCGWHGWLKDGVFTSC